MSSELLQPIVHQTLSVRVYHDLREFLMSGLARPGERLKLNDLAQRLGTSQMPVREAIRQLVAERALVMSPNAGVSVPLMSKQGFGELLRIRIQLEGLAVEEAARCVDAPTLKQARQISDEFTREMRKTAPDATALIVLNKRFHFCVYGAAGMPMLLTMIEGLWLQVGPILNLELRSGLEHLKRSEAPRWHAALVSALAAKDAAAARGALIADLDSAARHILAGGGLID